MPMLRVRCQRCREWIPTGIVMDEQTFLDATDRTLITHCPKCNNAQAWTLDDVDRSVFKPAPSGSDAAKL
ncbi:MAG TPA: hypothetical protein VFV74_03855 [Burkholderiales bacterium]|nr:hypothetical protein [Burkholderiales bacterium]